MLSLSVCYGAKSGLEEKIEKKTMFLCRKLKKKTLNVFFKGKIEFAIENFFFLIICTVFTPFQFTFSPFFRFFEFKKLFLKKEPLKHEISYNFLFRTLKVGQIDFEIQHHKEFKLINFFIHFLEVSPN